MLSKLHLKLNRMDMSKLLEEGHPLLFEVAAIMELTERIERMLKDCELDTQRTQLHVVEQAIQKFNQFEIEKVSIALFVQCLKDQVEQTGKLHFYMGLVLCSENLIREFNEKVNQINLKRWSKKPMTVHSERWDHMDEADRSYMIFRILGQSRWNEKTLNDMPIERLKEIYEDILEKESHQSQER